MKMFYIFAVILLVSISSYGASNQNASQNAQNPNQEILDRLSDLETKIDDLAGPQVTATFCMSQDRAISLGADWILQIDAEFEAGVGWAEVFSGEGTYESKIPAGPIPSETAISVAASKGRGLNVCVDLPIRLGPTDTALLTELAQDINVNANDFPDRGKFQRRAHRLLNYTKLRVPGVQIRTDADPAFSTLAVIQEEEEGSDDEFDVSDTAVENIFTNGLRGGNGPFAVFKNTDIKNLVASLGGLPTDITAMINDPEQIINPISDAVNSGIDNMDCASFGIDTGLRNEKPGLNKLCNRLEGLPDYSDIERVLSGELIGELFSALDTLTIGDTAGNVKDGAQNRFCQTRIGQLPKFDQFCKR
ncbi:hypothetical protein [Sulfurovum sp. TSL1]|uniref:hypothetical protein n=1 Tax=Sulfurovum sp. TSL1 TaxID=2826994 RepID=UPI001CC672CA|nr:hypothetical protein [Sulfurovum sp. TSL1]GIT97580.1 hypothetical protein TSL1_04010 [Sulfurovum sp. TSL1]